MAEAVRQGLIVRLMIGCIRLYQRFLSPWLGQNCRFTPSCSRYAVEALQVHGMIRGSMLASWRILRCQPFCKGGHDPVPLPRGVARDRRHDGCC